MGPEESDIVLIFVVSATLVVVLAALVALFVVVYQQRLAAQDARLQRLETERQQALLRAIIVGQEQERKRLARELHDGIGSLLSGLKLHLRHQQGQPELAAAHVQALDAACQQLEGGIAEVRRVSHNLLPATLESFGLVEAINECIQPLQSAALQVALAVEGPAKRLDQLTELGLLRVVQELLSNTVRHAQASQVNIRLCFSAASIGLHYHDDGVGLPATQATEGHGLRNIESRVQAMQGTVAFGQPPGFSATIHVPSTTAHDQPLH